MPHATARRARIHGQGLAEFALVAPIAFGVIFGIIALGLWVFYQQQVANVAREAARFAAIHSSTAPCPTVGWRDPTVKPFSYYRCDAPNNAGDPYPWPQLTDAARKNVWGVDPARVFVNVCWSGYVRQSIAPSNPPDYSPADFPVQADDPAIYSDGTQSVHYQCTIGGVDPVANPGALVCGQGLTTANDDPASDVPFNSATAYACMDWSPPLAGFLGIPTIVHLRAVVTEVIHRQQ